MLNTGILLLITGVLLVIVGTILCIGLDDFFISPFLLALIPIGMGVFYLNSKPNVDDLQNSKAQYVLTETHRINEVGDTLSTEKMFEL